MAVAVKKHYLLVNQLGQSVDRRGPFVSEEAARKWAEKFYNYPCWVLAVTPVGLAVGRTTLDENGEPVQEG